MKKKITASVLGLLLAGVTAYASPVTHFEKGSIELEFGGTLGSKFHGAGELVDGVANGKSGFKYGVTAGLGNDWAIQYKGGKFKSEDYQATKKLPTPTLLPYNYGESKLQEINLIHRITPNTSVAVGWIQNKISFGPTVPVVATTSSGFHAGLLVHKQISEKNTLFAGFLAGKDVLFWEAGLSYKLSKDTHLNVSYGEREFKNVDLILTSVRSTEDYKINGISCVFSMKLK